MNVKHTGRVKRFRYCSSKRKNGKQRVIETFNMSWLSVPDSWTQLIFRDFGALECSYLTESGVIIEKQTCSQGRLMNEMEHGLFS